MIFNLHSNVRLLLYKLLLEFMELESAKPDNHESLFFHQQRNPVRQYRRVRKEPEELPQALRYGV